MFRFGSLFISLLVCLGGIFLLTISSTSAFAETKTFIKEYKYQASEDDSRNSSRVIALREVKRLLLEELGTYLESETEVKNFQLTRDQITTLTAGIVQTEIIEEKWDGRLYWLKSKITADSDKVVQSINDLRKDREKTKELEAMRKKSDELMREVERLRKDLASAKNGNRDVEKAAYKKSINELSAADWLEKGYAAKNTKEAIEAYSRAIELDSKNIEAYYSRARSSENNSAMADYYKLLTIEPKNSESYLIRAWTYKELEKRDLALQEFGKAIETASGSKEKATAYYDRGRYYCLFRSRPYLEPSSKDIPNALDLSIQDFSHAIELDPQDASYYSLRAGSYWNLSKYDMALQDYNTAIKIDPNNAGFYALRGEVLRALKKPEFAVADLSRAIALAPNSLFVTLDYSSRAQIYEELGKFDLALQDLNTLIKLQPKESSNYSSRADVYLKLGKYDLAIKDYTTAIGNEPNKPNVYSSMAYYGRAQAYAAMNNPQKAIADLKKAIQHEPDYKKQAQIESKFDVIRKHPEFIKLIGE